MNTELDIRVCRHCGERIIQSSSNGLWFIHLGMGDCVTAEGRHEPADAAHSNE